MIVTAFLGLLHSPTWFKFKSYLLHNQNNNNNKNNNINNHNNNKNKYIFYASKVKKNLTYKSIRNYSVIPSSQNISEELANFIKIKNLNPVFKYEDLNMQSVKQNVLNDTRYLSGIYLILNKFTGDYYIGSASTGKFNSRFQNHLFNFNGSKVVKNAVKKYKISEFAFLILELYPEITTKTNNKELLDLEDFYLKSLLPNYNILTEAGSSFGYKHTEISRIKMNSNYSEERRMTIGNLNKGKTFSAETIESMKKAALNRREAVYSEEAISNMKKKSKPIVVYNFDYTVFGQFASIIEASKSLGCDQKTLRRALKTDKNILRRR